MSKPTAMARVLCAILAFNLIVDPVLVQAASKGTPPRRIGAVRDYERHQGVQEEEVIG